MYAVFAAFLVLGVAPPDGMPDEMVVAAVPSEVGGTQTAASPRQGAELSRATHDALRRWAKVSDQQAPAAARELLTLYRELQADRELRASEREQLRLRVRGRLANLIPQINRRTAQEKRLVHNARPASHAETLPQPILAQWGLPAGGGMMGGMMPGVMGMPGMMGAGPAGTPANDDAGPELVELIRKTIAPQSWDVNGGPGSIYYWRPGRAMVVTNSSEVHERIADLLDQLERAGR
jgi:hypothetical protein